MVPVRRPIETPLFSRAEVVAEVTKQLLERIDALYQHHKIDSKRIGAANALIVVLAAQCRIPGFEIVPSGIPLKRVTKPSRWPGPDGIRLYVDIQGAVKEKKQISKAIECLINKDRKYKKQNPKTLYARYKEIRKGLGKEISADLEIILKCKDPSFETLIEQLIDAYDGNGGPFFSSPGLTRFFAEMAQRLNEQKDPS